MKYFERIAEGLPVDELVNAINAQPELWNQITDRQKAPGSAHHSTEAIFLRWCRGRTAFEAFNDLSAVDYPAASQLYSSIRDLFDKVLDAIDYAALGRVMVTNLKAGCAIDAHVDEGAYADNFDRFHVVLQSDPGNKFHVEQESFCAKPGELWWFNHKLLHHAKNNSARDRWHLIIDLVAPQYRALHV